jgi:hypothetical protein
VPKEQVLQMMTLMYLPRPAGGDLLAHPPARSYSRVKFGEDAPHFRPLRPAPGLIRYAPQL